MPYTNADALVEADWLESHIDNPMIKILDASWHMPNLGRNAKSEWAESHIPDAQYFDIDAISDGTSDLPHMLPDADDFARAISAMGIANDHHVVIYDSYGLFSATRAWWMFKVFGHKNVSLLNGGSLKWVAESRPMSSAVPKFNTTDFKATKHSDMVKSVDDIFANLESGASQIIDARAKERFNAEVAEPRPGLRSGHMPGALNVPFNLLLNDNKTLKSEADIRAVFDTENLNYEKPVITSCGTGVTACALSFALYLVGKKDAAVYDGSWTEWGGRTDTPIEPKEF